MRVDHALRSSHLAVANFASGVSPPRQVLEISSAVRARSVGIGTAAAPDQVATGGVLVGASRCGPGLAMPALA